MRARKVEAYKGNLGGSDGDTHTLGSTTASRLHLAIRPAGTTLTIARARTEIGPLGGNATEERTGGQLC